MLDVAIFEGGYGIEWHKKIAAAYNADHEVDGVRIELWGDPRTADIIKPRLLRRDPPDLILDERLPLWLLIGAEKLLSFNEALAQPALGGEGTWRSHFADGMLDTLQSDGQIYAIPAAYGAWLCWYDARLFRKKGWTEPKSWDEFLQLCAEVERDGVVPVALQGKYASFYAWNTLVSLYHGVGGLASINRINALEPGAFSHPDAVRAAALLQQLAREYMAPSALAMTHTESQLQFVNGHAAFIFCGIWLENEMKDSMPPGFELRCFRVPPIPGGKGNPALLHGQGMEYLFVPADARYPEEAFEFARYLVSPKYAPDMGREIGVISPLKHGTPRESVTPALQSVLDVIEHSESIYNVRLRMLLPEWTAQVMNAAIADLLRGDISPETFGARMDAGIAASLRNEDLVIPPYQPYDLARFGESR
ncbi:MAG: extracellular solute-binding protein [Candidatus Hydrogenedentales bacterium]